MGSSRERRWRGDSCVWRKDQPGKEGPRGRGSRVCSELEANADGMQNEELKNSGGEGVREVGWAHTTLAFGHFPESNRKLLRSEKQRGL